jgi:hypothetical protein
VRVGRVPASSQGYPVAAATRVPCCVLRNMFSKPLRSLTLGLVLLSVTSASAVDAPTLTAPCGGIYDPTVTIQLLWTVVPSADSYNVQVSMDPNFTWPEINLPAFGSSMMVSGLYFDAIYHWRVQTVDGGVLSAWSTPCLFNTISMPAPPAPELYVPADGTTGVLTSVTFQWGYIPATSIELQVSTDINFTSPTVAYTQGQLHTVNGLLYGQAYYWRVRGSNLGGTSPWSVVWSFNTATAVALRVYLQGPLSPGTLLMSDAMRIAALIPTTEPYTALGYAGIVNAGATIGAQVFGFTGNNAMVDWVLLEARHSTTNVVVDRWAVLVQRDGDAMLPNGWPVTIAFPSVPVRLAVRHRNHLGAMCATVFGPGTVPLDLTLTGTPMYGTAPTAVVAGVRALWSGDATGNGELKYIGGGNDRDPILLAIGGSTPTNTVNGYRLEDVNLDGVVKYTGVNNDRDPILTNIGGSTPTVVRLAQLP